MANHSSILAWNIPWTEEPGGLHSPWGHKEFVTTEATSHALGSHMRKQVLEWWDKGEKRQSGKPQK